MRRRDFITLLAGAAGAWTCADTFAAQKSPKARIGYLSLGSGKVIDVLASPTPIECCVDPECKSTRHDAYQNTKCWWWGDFNALGWREGENLHLDARFGNRDPASLPRLAAELVALRPDVLTAPGTPETKALQAVTKDIPIVFMTSSDPVGLGLVDSISRPGRNTTGISLSPAISPSRSLG